MSTYRICHACAVASGADTAERVRANGHDPLHHTCDLGTQR